MADRLQTLFGGVLGVEPDRMSDETSPRNTPQWDSLNAMHLVSAIEEAFDVSLTTREIMKMQTLGLARDVLRTKGVPNI